MAQAPVSQFTASQNLLNTGTRLQNASAHYLHLSFSFTSFCRGKCFSLRLAQLSQSDGRRPSWSFWCSTPLCPEPPHKDRILEASTMEEIYDILARRLLLAAAAIPPSSKYIVGLAGPPGAGKSTVAKEVSERLNSLWLQTNPRAEWGNNTTQDSIAIALPMDGFHLYRSQLDMMEDPVEAHARRGAPWTFDPDGLLECLNSLRNQGWVHAPSFDHGVGDPKENDIIITPSHRVIVVEGNYLLLSEEKWEALMDMFDERWFLDVDIESTLKRVVKRFISQGKPPDEANLRVNYNDRKNAELILATKVNADLVIKSVEL